MEYQKKKVLHIVECFGGGVYSFLDDIINQMGDEFNITVAYGIRNETPSNFKKNFSSNVNFVKIENFTRNISIKKDLKALKEIKRIIKTINPDIIHLHSSKAGVLGRFAMKGKKTKMFYNPHGFSFLKKDETFIKRLIYFFIEKLMAIYNRKCIIIGCSKGEYNQAKKISKKAICINNGINIDKINDIMKKRKKYKSDDNPLKICTVGRIDYSKNPELFNQIAEKFPNIKFKWIGDGELKDKLVSGNIIITGWKKREEVLKILNQHNIFILTSLWEGLPISLLEAMYLKKICIVSDCIGNRDVINNGENGFLASNIDQYIEIIKQINDNKIKKITKNAYNDVLNNYDIKKVIQKYKKIYKEN